MLTEEERLVLRGWAEKMHIQPVIQLLDEVRTLQQQNKQLVEALEAAETEMDQWRDAGHAMACVKVIVNNALQSIKGES